METKSSSDTKYYDIENIWSNHATPDDDIIKYTLYVKHNDKVLLAHMLVDPVLEITKKQIQWMMSQGFTEYKKHTIKRNQLTEDDISLLKKSQYVNPDEITIQKTNSK